MGETAGDRIQEIQVEEFVRRLKRLLEGDAQVAWFLGAGASKSSGIPLAAELTRTWLRQLHAEAAPKEPLDDHVARMFPAHDPKDPAASYSDVMTRLFQTAADQQEEIERLVAHHDPGFGYATFAQLLDHQPCGPRCNVVFTTNFDDLVADALYLYTRTRPLVVSHASLADFAATGRTRPTIVKLHGDAMLAPLNDAAQLAELHHAHQRVLTHHLRDRALIFLGYGGHDQGVTGALKALPEGSISRGIYWVSDRIPDTELGEWLRQRPETFHVPHLDFDELMAVVKEVFDLPHPQGDRFDSLLKHYQDTFTTLQGEVDADDTTPDVVRDSVDSARAKFDSWFAVEAEAARYRDTDPERAEQIYRDGLDSFPDSATLQGNYAIFLWSLRDEGDAAEEHFRRALDVASNHANNLGQYALFLTEVRHDHDAAETHYRQALRIDAHHATNLGNFALFLTRFRHDHDAAEAHYRRALAVEPDNTRHVGNYAHLLWIARGDRQAAEEHYRRALDIDPRDVRNLGQYASFLTEIGDHDAAEEHFRRALDVEPGHITLLGSYAQFLIDVRHDHDAAEAHYRRALEADPTHPIVRGNYAGLLWSTGRTAEARQLVDSVSAQPEFPEVMALEIDVYRIANDRLEDDGRRAALGRLRRALAGGVRTTEWSFALNIERAETDGAPPEELDLLRALAAVATDEEPIESLDRFPEWVALGD